MLGCLEVVEYSLKERFNMKYLHQVSYLRLQDVIGVCLAGRILFDTKRKRENSRVWPFEVRVMLLLDRSRAWMILTGTQLWIACGHTTVVSHS